MNNPMDYLKIAVITWGAVFVFNKLLTAAGLSQFAATASAQASS
jgi:hypothetical protein